VTATNKEAVMRSDGTTGAGEGLHVICRSDLRRERGGAPIWWFDPARVRAPSAEILCVAQELVQEMGVQVVFAEVRWLACGLPAVCALAVLSLPGR